MQFSLLVRLYTQIGKMEVFSLPRGIFHLPDGRNFRRGAPRGGIFPAGGPGGAPGRGAPRGPRGGGKNRPRRIHINSFGIYTYVYLGIFPTPKSGFFAFFPP